MNFSKVEKEYKKLKRQFEAGKLSEEDFKALLKDKMIQDDEGRWWMIGSETGQWFVHEGENWVRSEPRKVARPRGDKEETKPRTTGLRKVLIGGGVLGSIVCLLTIAILLGGDGQSYRPTGGVGATVDVQVPVTGTEYQEPTTDTESLLITELEAAVLYASLTESVAGWDLDKSILYDIFTGDQLSLEIDYIDSLIDAGAYASSILHDSQYHEFYVSDDGYWAEVYLTETWDTTYYSIETDECRGVVPMHDVPQTVYLEFGSNGWMVYDIEFYADAPETETCS